MISVYLVENVSSDNFIFFFFPCEWHIVLKAIQDTFPGFCGLSSSPLLHVNHSFFVKREFLSDSLVSERDNNFS